MASKTTKTIFSISLVVFILWVIARIRDGIASDPFDVEEDNPAA
jgi:hypothetical protein